MTTSSPQDSSTYDPQKASLGELFSRLANDTSTLVRQEVALLRAEMTQSVKGVVGLVIKFALAGVFALLAVLVLLAASVIGLGVALNNYWLSALIIGGVLLLLAAIFGFLGFKSLKGAKLAPTQTIETLRDDAQWLKEQVKS